MLTHREIGVTHDFHVQIAEGRYVSVDDVNKFRQKYAKVKISLCRAATTPNFF